MDPPIKGLGIPKLCRFTGVDRRSEEEATTLCRLGLSRLEAQNGRERYAIED